MYNVALRRVPATTVAVGMQYILHILSEFVAFGIKRAKRMRHSVRPGSTIFFHIIS